MREHFLDADGSLKTDEFITFVISALKIRGPNGRPGVTQEMRQDTLGKIIFSFKKIHTGLTTKVAELLPVPALLDSYNPETLLRHIAAACLAHIICDRLDPSARHNVLPSYRRPRVEPGFAGNPQKDPLN